jgi:hypothetical protein
MGAQKGVIKKGLSNEERCVRESRGVFPHTLHSLLTHFVCFVRVVFPTVYHIKLSISSSDLSLSETCTNAKSEEIERDKQRRGKIQCKRDTRERSMRY